MVAQKKLDVKDPDDRRSRWAQFLDFLDCHPRVGWMWAFLMGLNTILNILDLFH